MIENLKKRVIYSFYSIIIMPVLWLTGVMLILFSLILPILVLLFPDAIIKENK